MPDDLTLRDKDHYVADYASKTARGIAPPNWTPQQKVALVCRILAGHGHASGVAGQVSLRGPRPGTFWLHDYRLGLEEACARNAILVDADLKVLEGEGMANPGARFHSWIYAKRPDVNAICHTHPPYASALSMLEVPLAVSHMDTVGLFEEVGFLAEWPGIPFGDDEGRVISDALGDRRCVFLSHHGPLTACATLEEACVLLVTMEKAAKLQLLASAAGAIRPIREDHGREGKRLKQTPGSVATWFSHYARVAVRANPECLL